MSKSASIFSVNRLLVCLFVGFFLAFPFPTKQSYLGMAKENTTPKIRYFKTWSTTAAKTGRLPEPMEEMSEKQADDHAAQGYAIYKAQFDKNDRIIFWSKVREGKIRFECVYTYMGNRTLGRCTNEKGEVKQDEYENGKRLPG